jgi:hypothetical protein
LNVSFGGSCIFDKDKGTVYVTSRSIRDTSLMSEKDLL